MKLIPIIVPSIVGIFLVCLLVSVLTSTPGNSAVGQILAGEHPLVKIDGRYFLKVGDKIRFFWTNSAGIVTTTDLIPAKIKVATSSSDMTVKFRWSGGTSSDPQYVSDHIVYAVINTSSDKDTSALLELER